MSTLLDRWRLLLMVLADKRMSKGDAAVAAMLLEYATDERGAWPSLETLARRVGMHRTSVMASGVRLVSAGYFRRDSGRGRGQTHVYWPEYEKVAQTRPFEAEKGSVEATISGAEKVEREDIKGSAGTHKRSSARYPNPLSNPPMNPETKVSNSIGGVSEAQARNAAWAVNGGYHTTTVGPTEVRAALAMGLITSEQAKERGA